MMNAALQKTWKHVKALPIIIQVILLFCLLNFVRTFASVSKMLIFPDSASALMLGVSVFAFLLYGIQSYSLMHRGKVAFYAAIAQIIPILILAQFTFGLPIALGFHLFWKGEQGVSYTVALQTTLAVLEAIKISLLYLHLKLRLNKSQEKIHG